MNLLNLEDIMNVKFRRSNVRGYNSEDVDAFLDRVQETFSAHEEKEKELQKKLSILAKAIEQYRSEEESIKNTLLNAQKIADASVREAQHKAETITRDAEAKAQEVVGSIEERYDRERGELEKMQKEVIEFKKRILEQYKEHIQLIGAMAVIENTEEETGKSPEEDKEDFPVESNEISSNSESEQ